MPHLSYLGLENFRVFKNQTDFEFAPISILTGTNSSGKSSVIKALLLLQDNFIKAFPFIKLDFKGELHQLGTFNNIVNNSNNNVSFTLPIDIENITNNVSLHFEKSNDDSDSENIDNIIRFPDNWKLKIDFFSESKDNEYGTLKELSIFNQNGIDLINYMYSEKTKISDFPYISFINIEFLLSFLNKQDSIDLIISKEEKYTFRKKELLFDYEIPEEINNKKTYNLLKKIETEALIQNFSKISCDYNDFIEGIEYYEIFGLESSEDSLMSKIETHISENIYLKSIVLGDNSKNNRYDGFGNIIYYFFKTIFENIFPKKDNIKYLPSLRGNISRVYTNKSQEIILNQLLLDFFDARVSSTKELSYEEDKRKERMSFVNDWVKKFEIGDEFIIKRTEGTISSPYIIKGDKKILLADLGFGITQVVPILMKIGLSYNNENFFDDIIIIIEEPEANLHPKFQSMLADMFIDAHKKFRIQFIIETHSEYLIRKLQYLTAKKDINPEDTVIYYLNDPNKIPKGEKQVKKININEDGSLTEDFGQGFFDEAIKLKLDLLKLKNTKN